MPASRRSAARAKTRPAKAPAKPPRTPTRRRAGTGKKAPASKSPDALPLAAGGKRRPKSLAAAAESTLNELTGVPWHKAGAMPQFNGYKGLLADTFYQFASLQNLGVDGVTGAVLYESKFGIDSDGASDAGDSSHQGKTSLRRPDGTSLDAREHLYAVLPLDAAEAAREGLKKTPGLPDFGGLGLRLGDLGVAFWKGRQAVFVYADKGPPNALGEGSSALARALGIDADPSNGGFNVNDLQNMGRGVVHVAFPGSGDWSGTGQPRTARTPAQVAQLALALWAAFQANATT